MNKESFLTKLRERLSGFPQEEVEGRILYYGEKIDYLIEDGKTEEEAVAELGSVDEIADKLASEFSLSKIVMENAKKNRKIKPWVIVLLVLFFPVWFSLAISALAVLFSVFVSIWAVILSFYIADFAIAVVAVATVPVSIMLFTSGNTPTAFFLLGSGFVLAGITILLFLLAVLISRGAIKLFRMLFVWIKSLFIKKEAAADA